MKKVLLCSLGSRGDVEPFLALAEELIASGSEVGFCFSEQFRDLAEEVGGSFYPQSKEFLELFDDPDVKGIMGQVGSRFSRLRSMFRLLKATGPIQKQVLIDQRDAIRQFEPDEIIFHTKCIYAIFWGMNGGKVKLLSPIPCMIQPTDHEPHIGFGKPRSVWWNRFTYKVANYVLFKTVMKYSKDLIKRDNLPVTKRKLKDFYLNKLEIEYAVSPKLFPRPEYWPDRLSVSEFRERNKQKGYEPPLDLVEFLNQHPKPVYIGFGSMINSKPKIIGQYIIAVCELLDLSVIVNTSWGGIELPDEVPENVFVINNVPYDYLFGQVGAVIHHGGSGTTHSAFRFNLPQLIIPHIADQPFWSRTVLSKSRGVEGYPIKKWNRMRFEKALRELKKMMTT